MHRDVLRQFRVIKIWIQVCSFSITRNQNLHSQSLVPEANDLAEALRRAIEECE
jgi:hypothetical protein